MCGLISFLIGILIGGIATRIFDKFIEPYFFDID